MRAVSIVFLSILACAPAAHAGPWPDLAEAPRSKTREGARDAALIVAIEDYAHVPDVRGARRNAADWRAWLRARGVTEIEVLQDADAWHRFDADGQPLGILSRLDRMAAKVKPGGTLWFVFIGHGAPVVVRKDDATGSKSGVEPVLLAHGVRQTADGLRADGISLDAQILPRLRPKARGARSVAVLDTCFSGKDTAGRAVVPKLQPLIVAGSSAVPAGVTLLSAAKGDQFAGPLPGLGRPAFSYLALGALRGWADDDGDGNVTANEVRQYVEDALYRVVKDRTQTPDAQGEVAAALARVAEAAPDLAAIAQALTPTRPVAPRDDFEARLAEATAGAAAVDTTGMSPLDAEMARLAAQQAERQRIEREEAERKAREEAERQRRLAEAAEAERQARERAMALHTADVDAKWAKVKAVARDPAKGVRAVEAFVGFYAAHPLGNPRQAEAEALKTKLEATLEAEAARAHAAEVERAWALTKKVAKRGGPEGKKALELFLKQYADHPRGNPKSDEAQSMLWDLGGGGGGRGKAGIEWVRIPGGSFRMGSTKGGSDEKPVRTVRVGDLALSKTEVTVGQYRACVDARACTAPDTGTYCNWDKSGRDDHPINCVDWEQASAFAKWAGGRLPSEAEWEYAARSGGKSREYPWGDQKADCSRAVMDDGSGNGCGKGGTTFPVCSKPAGNTAQGVCDMAGNVWEWVADWYGPYGEAPNDGSARTRTAQFRVGRGGGWNNAARGLRAAHRSGRSPGGRRINLGFRVARATP